MPAPTTGAVGASTPTLCVASWNVGMNDPTSFARHADWAIEMFIGSIKDSAFISVEVIGLNEAHPPFFAQYGRAINDATSLPPMGFVGMPPRDAVVWRR